MISLAGKAALITGGSRGIGAATVKLFAQAGADVVFNFHRSKEAAAQVEQEARKAVLVAGDIRDPAHCRSLVERAVDELGGVDILVNNAAHQATFDEIGEISDEEWRMTFDVNIHAMFYLTKAAAPHMKPGSAIINTASVTSDMPNQTLLAYSTTKGAIQNFTGGLAQMLAERACE